METTTDKDKVGHTAFIKIEQVELNAWAGYVWRHAILGSFAIMKDDHLIPADTVADIAVGTLERFIGDINPTDRQRIIDKLSFAVTIARSNATVPSNRGSL